MYFDTIHDLPEFDEVCAPEDGYASYWETDTEIDEELGNFIFSNVAGDSASVICIDEAMDLLALREQRLLTEREEAIAEEEERQFRRQEKELDRPGDRHSRHSSASRHSHHSGSDGTYEGPVQANITRRPSNAHEHVYETLDDCRAEFQARAEGIYVSKGSDGSRESNDSTAKLSDNATPQTGTARPTHRSTKHRSVSLSQPPESIIPYHIRHRRKLSEGADFLHKVSSKTRPDRTDRVAPKSCSPPAKGYSFPAGVPRGYADYIALPGAPASPERRHSHQSSSKKKLPPPSLIIKHKGKTYIIPVVDKKTQQKSRAKGTQETPKHATLNTLSRSNSTAFSTTVYNTTGTMGRRHGSPPKAEASEQTHRKNKSKQPPTQGAQVSGQAQALAKQVTHIHYGVV